jgi:hypothetical protein
MTVVLSGFAASGRIDQHVPWDPLGALDGVMPEECLEKLGVIDLPSVSIPSPCLRQVRHVFGH